MRSILLALATLGIATIGCGSSTSASAESNVVSSGGLCQTLDYGHTRSNADYFLPFADDAAAFDYAKGFLESNGRPAPREISNDPRLRRIIDEVYRGFRIAFPRETDGFETAPRIAILDSEEVNAFAGYDDRPEVDKAPWVFFVHSAVLNLGGSDGEIAGLFAHELGHLVLRNVLPETRAKIRAHYLVPASGDGDVFGASAADDANVRAHAEELREIDALAGRNSMFGQIPVDAFVTPAYQQLFLALLDARAQSVTPEACDTAMNALQSFQNAYLGRGSPHTYTVDLSDAERATLASSEKEATENLKTCLSHVTMSLFELKLRLANIDPQTILPVGSDAFNAARAKLMANPIEQRIDSEQHLTTIERVFAVVKAARERAEQLNADPQIPVDQIRVYDMEEDADDAAVRVLLAMGSDPTAGGRFVLSLMPPDLGARCKALVDAGSAPVYGRFVDPHNTTCWRYYHTMKIAPKLAACGRTASGRAARAVVAPNEISAADPKPGLPPLPSNANSRAGVR